MLFILYTLLLIGAAGAGRWLWCARAARMAFAARSVEVGEVQAIHAELESTLRAMASASSQPPRPRSVRPARARTGLPEVVDCGAVA